MAAEADIDLYDAIEEDFTQEQEDELLNGGGTNASGNNPVSNDDAADLYDDVLTSSVKKDVKEEKNGGGDIVDEAITDTSGAVNASGDAGTQKFTRRWQVYVSNLTWWTNDVDVTQACNAIGVNDIIDIKFYENRANGQSRGFATVAVKTPESMNLLMEKIKTVQIHSQTLNVHYCNRQNLLMLDAASGGNRAEYEQERERQYQQQNAPPAPVRFPPRQARPPFQPGAPGGPRPGPMMGAPGPRGPPGPMPNRGPMPGPPPQGPPGGARPLFGPPGGGPPRGPPMGPGPGAPGAPPLMQGPPRGPPQQQPPQLGAPPQGMPGMAGPGPQPMPMQNQPGVGPGFLQQQPPPVQQPAPGSGPPFPGAPGMQGSSAPGNIPPAIIPQQPVPAQTQPGGMPPSSQPAAHVNPAFFPGGQPPQAPNGGGPILVDQFGRPLEGQLMPQPTGMSQPLPSGNMPPDSVSANTTLSDDEFAEILTRNKSVSSSAISRAVQDASQGDFASAIETLVTAISLIKQSKIANDDRCKILIASLQDTKAGIEDKSYGGSSSRYSSRERRTSYSPERDRRRSRSRDRDRDRRRDRSRSRERDRRDYRERSRDRDRGVDRTGERDRGGYYQDRSRDRYY